MVTRFVPRPDLDALVARKYAYPAVDRALDRLRDLARTNAPPVKVWVTARDDRVRDTHVQTDGQAVPANLPFKLPAASGVGHDLAGFPRDPDLPIEQRINCRCADPVLPELLRDSIHRTDVTLQGHRVSGEAYTRFKRAAESEFEQDGGGWMRDALRQTALTMSSRQRT